MQNQEQIEMKAIRRMSIPATNAIADPGQVFTVNDERTAADLERRGLASRSKGAAGKAKAGKAVAAGREVAVSGPAEGADLIAAEKADARPASVAVSAPAESKRGPAKAKPAARAASDGKKK